MSPIQHFGLTISLNVLEHLGINLYSNVPSVLSEIVANAWDADAREVTVQWDRANGKIVITDDGTGMTGSEVNQRFDKVVELEHFPDDVVAVLHDPEKSNHSQLGYRLARARTYLKKQFGFLRILIAASGRSRLRPRA